MGILSLILNGILHPHEARAIITYKVWRDPLHAIENNPEAGWEREDMKRCWYFLDQTSRSFAAVIKELEGDLSRVVAIFYLILRALDTVEDDMTLDIETKAPILLDFHKYLEQDGWNFTKSGPNEKDRQLLVEFHVVITEYKRLEPHYKTAIADITQKMGAGMARYCKLHADNGGKFSVDTFASFDLYCHFVAGLVGEGLSRLFSASGKESPELGKQVSLSNSMGLLLQKTNILRDFREDTDEGRVFWPEEIWSKFVTKPEELYAVENKEKALWALSEMTVDALTHATDALDYLTLLGNQSVFNFCAIPQVMAIATLNSCFMDYNVFHKNVKIRKGMAVELILAATNPRDVAYIFRDNARKIHSRARANDPSFIKLAVLTGRIEQWCETRYPSYIQIGVPVPKFSSDWREGMDARIRQLPPLDQTEVERREQVQRLANGGAGSMTREDWTFLAAIVGGVVFLLALMCGIGWLSMWYFVLREGAPYAELGFHNAGQYAEHLAAVDAKRDWRLTGEL